MQTELQLPFLTTDIEPVAAIWKQQSEDFCVEEIPLYEPSGHGDHLFLWLEKTGIPTIEAVHQLAKFLKRSPREFGVAGLKDAKSVARQWVSIEHVDVKTIQPFRSDQINILQAVKHGNKLKTGHLLGNRFKLTLRALQTTDEILDRVRQVLDRLQKEGCPNFYTSQRFGRDGRNASYGRTLLYGLNGIQTNLSNTDEKWMRRQPKKTKQIWLSALQSELFNEVLSQRLSENTMSRILDGDLAYLHRNGAVFLLEDASTEQQRCSDFEISPSGPILGHKMISPQGHAMEIESAIFARHEIIAADFHCGSGLSQKGQRRPLRFSLGETSLEVTEQDAIQIQFDLPKGCYATAVLREICKHD